MAPGPGLEPESNRSELLVLPIKLTRNNFYILQEYRQSGSFILNNGCYASTKTGSVCDKISTMYASWALKEMNEEIATRAYLESQITVSDILENAIVGRITGKPVYLDFLKSTQETNTQAEMCI